MKNMGMRRSYELNLVPFIHIQPYSLPALKAQLIFTFIEMTVHGFGLPLQGPACGWPLLPGDWTTINQAVAAYRALPFLQLV